MKNYIKHFLLKVLIKFSKNIPDKIYISIQNWLILQKRINWSNPRTFSDKIQYLKLNTRVPLYTKLVDKVLVKEYVAKLIGEQYVIPTLGVYKYVDEIDWSILPEQFVLKCNHDGGNNSVVICYDKSKIDKIAVSKKLDSRLKFNNYWHTKEWPYKNISPCILVEKMLLTSTGKLPEDYKFYCFNGEPKLLLIITGRNDNNLQYCYLDMDFNVLPLMDVGMDFSIRKPIKPNNFELMVEIVKKLVDGIPFVRLDVYNIDGNIYFGEYTFYSGGGFELFKPNEWNNILGDWIDLTKIK